MQTEELHSLYSFYCQNIPQSEEMRRQVGEHNPFLRQCQMHLGHKLPLSAYLLKPVQRITKYQLLLKVEFKISKDMFSESQVGRVPKMVKNLQKISRIYWLNDNNLSLMIN